jgi:hypothetical protein
LSKGDGVERYTGLDRRYVDGAMERVHTNYGLPYYVYFLKATIEGVYPACSKEAKEIGYSPSEKECRSGYASLRVVKMAKWGLFGIKLWEGEMPS